MGNLHIHVGTGIHLEIYTMSYITDKLVELFSIVRMPATQALTFTDHSIESGPSTFKQTFEVATKEQLLTAFRKDDPKGIQAAVKTIIAQGIKDNGDIERNLFYGNPEFSAMLKSIYPTNQVPAKQLAEILAKEGIKEATYWINTKGNLNFNSYGTEPDKGKAKGNADANAAYLEWLRKSK